MKSVLIFFILAAIGHVIAGETCAEATKRRNPFDFKVEYSGRTLGFWKNVHLTTVRCYSMCYDKGKVFNLKTHKFVAPVKGVYVIEAFIENDKAGKGPSVYIDLDPVRGLTTTSILDIAVNVGNRWGSVIRTLNKGDTLEMKFFPDSPRYVKRAWLAGHLKACV